MAEYLMETPDWRQRAKNRFKTIVFAVGMAVLLISGGTLLYLTAQIDGTVPFHCPNCKTNG